LSDLPANIEEFNTIAGLIFAQLYKAFPVRLDLLDRQAIATAMGVPGTNWGAHILPSGQSFSTMLAYTLSWLVDQGYVSAPGAHPAERITLSEKGLAALNAIPSGLKQTIGSKLTEAAADTSSPGVANKIAELMGSFAGSFTRSYTE
jgi:hypothetical protein